MDAEMQSLILMMVLMICCGLQFIGQPFEITGVDNQRHGILPNLELAVLAVLIMTLWAGLFMFKLNESGDNDTLYTILTVSTVGANIIFILVLVFILVREILQEKRHEGSSFVLKMDRLFGIKSDPFSRRGSHLYTNPTLNADMVNTTQEISIEMTSTTSSTVDIASTIIENDLPDGWKAHKTETGTFYEEISSGLTQWKKPSKKKIIDESGLVHAQSNPMDQQKKHHKRNSTDMPDGWDKLNDDSGRRYYSNGVGSQWNPPEGSTGGSAGNTAD